jgi:putative membrane protein
MVALIIRLLANAVALAAAVWLIGGITLTGQTTASKTITLLVVAAIFGIVNAVIKPVLKLVTLPFLILTLGLLIFVINALMLWLTSGIAGLFGVPFSVDGFWAALLGSLVISIVSWLLNILLPDKYEQN